MTQSDVVKLALGDGAANTLDFLHREILPRFGNPILESLDDAVFLRLSASGVVVTTDSYIVDPPIFPGGDIGRLAVSGTVNDLLAGGARPQFLTFSLIIQEGFQLSILRQILDSVRQTCDEAKVQIIAGDTKVISKTSQVGIIINTTGLGYPISNTNDYRISNAKPNDQIIITGTLGDHSLSVLSAREGLGFESRVASDCAPLTSLLIPILNSEYEIRCLRDPTRGGLIGALVDIAEASNVDLVIDESAIPIREEVRFGCEMLGIDPLTLVNEGKMIILASDRDALTILRHIQSLSLGENAAIIGSTMRATFRKGNVILKSGRKKRVALRPSGEPLPRLC